jgi:hypothetical protein
MDSLGCKAPRPTRPSAFLLTAALLLTGVAAAVARDDPEPAPPQAGPSPSEHAVVIELFTSQGCSTCPPADRLLRELGGRSAGRLVPLAYHVDSWNYIGWTDPFSDAGWTKRQEDYARKLGLRRVYTPQAVVDGGAELVGSDARALQAAIATAAARPAASIALRLEPSSSKVRVEADVDLPEALRDRKWDLMLAVYETGLSTPVSRGENGGKTLQNDYVVRSLRRAGRLKTSSKEEASLSLERGWDRAHLGVAAFLQDPKSLEIRGASARFLDAP